MKDIIGVFVSNQSKKNKHYNGQKKAEKT